MLSTSSPISEGKKLYYAIFLPLLMCLSMAFVFFLQWFSDDDFHQAGIFPRHISSVFGIFTVIFIHADWSHLLNNLLAFFLLSVSLFYFYRQIAVKVLICLYLCSGLILWCIGRDSWHVGASGLDYALAFFLFFSGVFRRHVPLVAISLIVIFLYGNMVWHLFPWQEHDPVSWEGHLAGGITGLVFAVLFRKQGPQLPKVADDIVDEEYEEEFWNQPESDEMDKT